MGHIYPNPWYRTRARKRDAPPKGAFHVDVETPNSLPISPYQIPWKPANEIMEWDYMFFLAMTGSFFLTKILKHFGCWPFLLMRFWRNRFLKGQTTSDETVLKIFITKQILLHNFALPVFFRPLLGPKWRYVKNLKLEMVLDISQFLVFLHDSKC